MAMTILPLVLALLAGLTAAPEPVAWQVDLAHPVSSGDLSRVDPSGAEIAVYAPHALSRPANTFTTSVDGSATVDVRGREPDGHWTEWTETPAVLPVPTRMVQVRLVYQGAVPRAVTVHPSSTA